MLRTLNILLIVLFAAAASAEEFDVVIAGGTHDAVAVAEQEARAGKRVFLLAPRAYLGEDCAGNLSCLEKGVVPLEAKRSLDRRLLAAGVRYVTGAYVVGVSAGRVVYAAKDGMKEVAAHRFLNRTMPLPMNARRFARILVSETPPSAEGLSVECLPGDYTTVVTNRVQEDGDGSVRIVKGKAWKCSFTLPFAVTDVWTRARAEVYARDLTWTPGLLDGADELICLDSECVSPRDAVPAPIPCDFDVAVAGGGVAGAPAAIAAARRGARTVVCEFLHQLGGVGTAGGIGQYWQGRVQGFTCEYDNAIRSLGCAVHSVGKREAWRRMCRDSGVTVLFGALVCGAECVDGKLHSLKVATDYGLLEIRVTAVVDATGNADVAAAAGAETVFVEPGPLSVQGAGLAPRPLGVGFVNSDFGYVDDSSAEDRSRFAVCGRLGAPAVWDVASLVGARDRRRIVGDVTVTAEDIVIGRAFPDAVVQCRSNFDSHGPTFSDLGLLSGPSGKRFYDGVVPYRAMLPRGVHGVVVPGLGMSAARDAMPVLRMQPDVQNAGYAAGVAAAMAVSCGGDFRKVDVKVLQRELVKCGNIDENEIECSTLPHDDGGLKAAIERLVPDYREVAVVLASRERALPILREAFASAAEPDAKLVYAHVLGILGCADGADVLADWIEGRLAAKEPDFKGKWAYARRFPYRDSVLIALGRTRTSRARDVLTRMAGRLSASTPFFRFRAICWALESCGDKRSAAVLREVSKRPEVTGHAKVGAAAFRPLYGYTSKRHSMTDEEMSALKELDLATAVHRLSGDSALLKPWLRDGRKVFSDYAKSVVAKGMQVCR